MVRLTRIYTKIGDDGTTRLVDGTQVPKNDPRVSAYGNLDELSSYLGVVVSLLRREEIGAHPAFSNGGFCPSP